jgi:osmotically-inducible protein OsmY
MDYRRHYDEDRRGGRRDWSERAGDELRSWAGDDDARFRRMEDERREQQGFGSDDRRDDLRARSAWFDDGRDASRRYQAQGGDHRQRADHRSDERSNESHRYGTGAQYGGDFSGNRRDYADPTRGQRLGLDSGPDDWSDASHRASRDFGRDREFGRGSGWQSYGSYGSQAYGSERDSVTQPGYGYGHGLSDSHSSAYGGSQSFAGKGPKDYKRSDDRIREELSDRLTDDHGVDASEISVQVKQGDVTLTGTVATREQKRRAEDIAERTSGVNEVTNQIRVARDDQSTRGTSAARTNGTTGASTTRPATGLSS